jgi:hypothetical protein
VETWVIPLPSSIKKQKPALSPFSTKQLELIKIKETYITLVASSRPTGIYVAGKWHAGIGDLGLSFIKNGTYELKLV